MGLSCLLDNSFAKIGNSIQPVGSPTGSGISAKASKELHLPIGAPVATSIIDAHAGGICVIGAQIGGLQPPKEDFEKRLALICGTSSCHMAVSGQQCSVPGIWWPYYSAMLPEMRLNEGGQSATGALIDHILSSHSQYSALESEAQKQKTSIYALLNSRLQQLTKTEQLPFTALLSKNRHILPCFHGNRSPRADASLQGIISGLRLNGTADDLAITYLATIQAIAHGTRHIIDTLNAKGYAIDTVFSCGGLSKNPLFLQEHADILGCRIVLPKEEEAVLLGSACLGAVAGGIFSDVFSAMAAMNRAGEIAAYHHKKYKIFLKMYDDFLSCRKLMEMEKTKAYCQTFNRLNSTLTGKKHPVTR